MNGRVFILALAAVGLTACGGGSSSSSSSSGGGSSSGTVVGLELPSNVSVVTAQSDQSAGGVMLKSANGQSAMGLVTLSTFPADAQINTDPTNTYVWDESMQSLSTVNEILCYVSQTGASSMINKGAYTALVNEKKCEQGQNQSSAGSTGQSSTTQTVSYNKWTIEATRADNSSPEIVHIWVPGKASGTDPRDKQTILVEMTVNEGISSTNPFGKFSMNFKGVVDGGDIGGTPGTEVTVMKGTLKTVDNSSGTPQFQFVENDGSAADSNITDFSSTNAVNVVLDDASGTTGHAHASYSNTFDNGSGPTTQAAAFVADFNPADFLRGKDANGDNVIDGSAVCTSRTDFNTHVWQYNLYYKTAGTDAQGTAVTAGQRVELNSGFPFIYDNNGTKVNGNLSYWGLWVENDVSVPDGATITKVSYNNNASTGEDLTVHVTSGKLVRRAANTANLADFQGQEFQYYGALPSTPNQYSQYFVTVGDGTNSMTPNHFYATDSFTWGDNGPVRSALSGGPVDVTPTNPGESLNMHSDALGGDVIYVAGDSTITYYTQDFINAGDDLFSSTSSVTMYCYDRCLKGGLTDTDITNAVNNNNGDQDLYYANSSSGYAYTANVVNGKLIVKDQNGLTVDFNGMNAQNMQTLGHDWGIATGEMVVDNSNISNPWDVYGAPVTYHWETGSNDWNHLITVTDSNGAVVKLDPPLSFNYTHTAENDANGSTAAVGQKFLLQYGGPGQLWGFPDNQDSSNRWYPTVSLKSGAELTDANNTVYVVKQIEREQQMNTATLSDCTGAGLDVSGLFTSLPLPTSSDIGTVSITKADKPTVTDPPAVIAGEIQ